jgi:hypothetical protein
MGMSTKLQKLLEAGEKKNVESAQMIRIAKSALVQVVLSVRPDTFWEQEISALNVKKVSMAVSHVVRMAKSVRLVISLHMMKNL